MHETVLGVEEFIDALSRADQRALEQHLIRLMQLIIKWKAQPERRSRSWVAIIRHAREAVREIQEDTPSLTDHRIRQGWEACLRKAHGEAEGDINQDIPQIGLSWEEVFEAHRPLRPTKPATPRDREHRCRYGNYNSRSGVT